MNGCPVLRSTLDFHTFGQSCFRQVAEKGCGFRQVHLPRRFGASNLVKTPFSGDHGGGNELLSNWMLIARVSKDCERTDVTLNGDLLVKVIDEHDVAGHIVSL
jgi:hypothetical protein